MKNLRLLTFNTVYAKIFSIEKEVFIKPSTYVADAKTAEAMAYAEIPHRNFINSSKFNALVEEGAQTFGPEKLATYGTIRAEIRDKQEWLDGLSNPTALSPLEQEIIADNHANVYDENYEVIETPELTLPEKREKVSRILASRAVEHANSASQRVYRDISRKKYIKGLNKKSMRGGLPTLGKSR